MTNRSHDWQVPPTEWRYDGQPLAEFEDPMLLAHERVRIRFGGAIPRDVGLALNESYRRGRQDARTALVYELRRQAEHVPTGDEAEITWMRAFRNLADSLERFTGWPLPDSAASQNTDGTPPNPQASASDG